jgi:hypothetical protein
MQGSDFDKSIVANKYGTLLVLDDFKIDVKKSKTGKVYKTTLVKCHCDCGNIKYILRGYVLSAKYPSCGCLSNSGINLVGQRFGKLTVISQTVSRNGRKSWYCKCDCGSDKIVSTKLLRSNQTRSCGCLQHSERNFHKNWEGTQHIAKTFFTNIQRGAKSRNIVFDITITDLEELYIKQNKKCALSGIDLIFSNVTKNKFGIGNASLDRIDSSIGYIKNNIQWVDKKINIMKNKLNQSEFVDLCSKIYKYNYENKI